VGREDNVVEGDMGDAGNGDDPVVAIVDCREDTREHKSVSVASELPEA